MQKIIAQCQKELVQFSRDHLTLALAFILPMISLLIYGFALRLESKNIPLIVQDFDQTSLSRNYIERLYTTNQFIPVKFLESKSPINVIDSGIAKAAVIIPSTFSRDIQAQKSTTVQVLIDATDVNNARVIRNSIKGVTNFFIQAQGLVTSNNMITAHSRIWFNPGRLESLFFVPGCYGVVLWIYPSLLTAIAMVREKEKGTIIQAYASSISAAEFLLGKGLAYLLIALTEAVLVMVIASLIFQVSLVGDFINLSLGTLLFLIDSVLFGLLVGIRSGDQNSAVQSVSLVGFVTSLMLSGFIYPLSNIPFPISILPNIIPARYYMEITRDAFVRGIGWQGNWFNILMLALLAMILFGICYKIFKKMQLPN